MTEADHRQLIGVLLALKGKVILSGYANDLYDGMLCRPGWGREEIPIANHASGAKKKRQMVEVLWFNFTPEAKPCS